MTRYGQNVQRKQMFFCADRLIGLRKLAKLNQSELADLVGVGRTCLANWEAGINEPPLKHLVAIAKALNVSTDYLLNLSPLPREKSEQEPLPFDEVTTS